MTIIINRWAETDPDVQAQLAKLKPLYEASGCVGLAQVSLNQDPASIKKKLDALFSNEDEEIWLKIYYKKTLAYLDCGYNKNKIVIFFLSDEEADAFLVYPAVCNENVHISFDNWLVISLDPLLLLSMYGAILGICQTLQGTNIVTLEEGDPGW